MCVMENYIGFNLPTCVNKEYWYDDSFQFLFGVYWIPM